MKSKFILKLVRVPTMTRPENPKQRCVKQRTNLPLHCHCFDVPHRSLYGGCLAEGHVREGNSRCLSIGRIIRYPIHQISGTKLLVETYYYIEVPIPNQSFDNDLYPEGGAGTPSYTNLGFNLYLWIERILRSSLDHHSLRIFCSSHQLHEVTIG